MGGMILVMFGVAIAIKAMEMFRAHEGSDKAVESAKGKVVDYIDRLWK
jgi:hypothetical protein